MSLKTASILVDGTIDVTGGTATAMQYLSGDQTVAKTSLGGTSLLDRVMAVFTRKEPKVSSSSPDGYTQPRRRCLLKFPKTTAAGALTYATIVIEYARSIETTSAETDTQLGIASQVITDSDFSEFWDEGSLD
jgi:hypothetical protein